MTNGYKLRQLALVARDLASVEADLSAIFGLEVAYRDPAVAKWGLENIVVPVGNQFLEVVAPTRPGTTAGRYLDRRGGDGGYMVILQTEDPRGRDARVAGLGIRTVHQILHSDYDGLQLHPRDTGGSFLEIDWAPGFAQPDGSWHPAGENWRTARRTEVATGLLAAEIQTPDPGALAARWSAILGRPTDGQSIPLDLGTLRFAGDQDGRGEGLGGIDIAVADKAHVLREGERRGRLAGKDMLLIGGTRFNLIA
ncbi:VOC family protein [Emcibacter sp. SYSU 3D8]|uniref:VOC family protein n=1 Tax=Emcibacter sp. SYSU 3D8 TaxID=3133969 RepID=UPI0031FEE1B6